MPTRPLTVTEDQALWFRARRGHLAGKGAADEVEVVRAVLGVQAQLLGPALWAVALRTRARSGARPTAAAVETALMEAPRTLVRTWGQRHTLHAYDAAADWASFLAAQAHWSGGGRRADMAPDAELDAARERLEALGRPATRSDLFGVLTRRHLREWEDKASSREEARRFAAGRLFWGLARRGELCTAGKAGAEQEYALREHWFPELRWRKPAARKAALALAARYLALHGPATVRDLAHFFGAHAKEARAWVDTLAEDGRLVEVRCAGREGLVALAADAAELRKKPPAAADAWPARLVPNYDTLLMGQADKSWTVPVEAERKRVWRAAAYVAAVVLARGRVVALWKQAKKAKALRVEVQPLSGWRKTRHLRDVEREAEALAAHHGLGRAEVVVESTTRG